MTKTNVVVFSSEGICLDNRHSIKVMYINGKRVLSVR